MDWNDVRYFLALARLGSVRAAGAALGVSHSTVARRVDALETRLAARLFDRNRDGYCLTEAGKQMLPPAERIEGEMAALERGLIGQDERLSGTVALTCCDNFVADLLMEHLTAFCDVYPDIELRMVTDSRAFDLSKREADVAIRALARGTQPPEHLIGMQLVPVVVCSYVAIEHAAALEPENGSPGVRWVSYDDPRTTAHMIAGTSYPDIPAWGAFSSMELMLQAARHGLGIVMLPTYVGDRAAGLQRLTKPDLRHAADLWLLSHPDLRDNARFRATRACVAEGLRKHRALFTGEGWSTVAPAGPEIATPAPSEHDVQ